jgi:maleylacetoacetate isomerase
MIKLYHYWRSSASYRVRIGLNLKGIAYESVPINLANAEQKSDTFRTQNPQGYVPALAIDGIMLTQSLAILEYLDECFPEPFPFLPKEPRVRAAIRAMSLLIACDIHPLNNLSVLGYLRTHFGQEEQGVQAWYQHWIINGFKALESFASDGPYIAGDHLSLADILLVPQMANARRFNVDCTPFPKLQRLDRHLRTLEPFIKAAPEQQAEAQLA